ncbi:UPF0149 family protein [Conservatibacter flavescens]|uniref:UPF0149 protein CVP05_10970 n=1 Tax=Conservatibacter flavescens TaxID=28161 RepID=A0A2M8S091_9PAST|nr:UPF0149 family protein [Conservatibacter flavescens]PJG84534.1 YecA family protein [Conservatibacter flavescens]
MTIELSSYEQFSVYLEREGIPHSAAEVHGLITGLIAGAVSHEDWLNFVYQFTNDGHAYPMQLLKETQQLYIDTKQKLADIDGFNFDLWLPEEDNIFQRADALSEWVSHFLLGIGLARPHFEKELNTPEIREAFRDLQDICMLSYDEDDDLEELNHAVEEIVEYVRTLSTLFFTHFAQFKPITSQTKMLH